MRGVVGVTYTTSFCASASQAQEVPARTNYNLRGHRSEVRQRHLAWLKTIPLPSSISQLAALPDNIIDLQLESIDQFLEKQQQLQRFQSHQINLQVEVLSSYQSLEKIFSVFSFRLYDKKF